MNSANITQLLFEAVELNKGLIMGNLRFLLVLLATLAASSSLAANYAFASCPPDCGRSDDGGGKKN